MSHCFFLKQISIAPRRFSITNNDGYKGDPCYNMWRKKGRRMVINMCYDERSLPVLTKEERSTTNNISLINEREDVSLMFYGEKTITNSSTQEIGIVRFLTGKVFLVTGATGFLAKVLIEKILRTIPDVSKIYLLIKAKNKEAAMERLKTEIMDTQLFKCLRQVHGKSYETFMLSKLVAVVGNVSDSNLGMEVGIADDIANQVDIIVNSAGNTIFDERYDVALHANTRGPCQLMRFAKTCKGLKVLLHVSTAYVNGGRQGVIMEKAFRNGDSIERERAASESPKRSFPLLDIESEFKIATNARDASHRNLVSQNMKQLGLERYGPRHHFHLPLARIIK